MSGFGSDTSSRYIDDEAASAAPSPSSSQSSSSNLDSVSRPIEIKKNVVDVSRLFEFINMCEKQCNEKQNYHC